MRSAAPRAAPPLPPPPPPPPPPVLYPVGARGAPSSLAGWQRCTPTWPGRSRRSTANARRSRSRARPPARAAGTPPTSSCHRHRRRERKASPPSSLLPPAPAARGPDSPPATRACPPDRGGAAPHAAGDRVGGRGEKEPRDRGALHAPRDGMRRAAEATLHGEQVTPFYSPHTSSKPNARGSALAGLASPCC